MVCQKMEKGIDAVYYEILRIDAFNKRSLGGG